jgi:DNA-binding NtrC family response regulator
MTLYVAKNNNKVAFIFGKIYAGCDDMKKIVVIDDEKDFVLLMKNFFVSKNYDVHVAYTIADGMTLLEKEKPDYIFLDNDMPDGAGWCQTEHILHTYPNAQLNLISALGVPKTKNAPFRILEKPIMMEDLDKIIQNPILLE